MDAVYQERQRDHLASRREKRWSMYSHRLEGIVAELMRPIGDIRLSFDIDLCALLEEYLTEAGLHALGEDVEPSVPNFVELALLLQHLARLYGRKVDFLYLAVLLICTSLRNNSQEEATSGAEEELAEASPTAHAQARRKRGPSGAAAGAVQFVEVELAPSAAAERREPEGARAPPTLPPVFIELEPRALPPGAAQLLDFAGEPLGLPADYYATWRLQDGFLVDELEGRVGGVSASDWHVSLEELQMVLAQDSGPAGVSTPLPLDAGPGGASTPLPFEPAPPTPPLDLTAISRTDRKRRHDLSIDELLDISFSASMNDEMRGKLRRLEEFTVSDKWVERVLRQRTASITLQRRNHLLARSGSEFRGFEVCDGDGDIGGFPGWSETEARAARERVRLCAGSGPRLDPDSEDDGFFERSSLGECDDTLPPQPRPPAALLDSFHAPLSWQEGVARRAAEAEARGGVDVDALAGALLDALPPAPPPAGPAPAAPFAGVLRAAAGKPQDVSRLLLVALFLANSGNVEIVQGPPLSVDSCAVRLLSRDRRLYAAALEADKPFLRWGPERPPRLH